MNTFEYNSKSDEYNEILSIKSQEERVYYDEVYSRKSISTYSNKSSRNFIRSNKANVITRIISKSGRLNIYHSKLPKKHLVYFRDLGNTLLNIRWRWIMISLCLVNFISFYLFGLLWMWIAYISGDFEENAENLCIINTKNLTGYILLSIETMLTIGYGYRYPTENCIQGWIVPFLQALVNIGIQGALVSVIYVKISKPFTKDSFGLFSKKAVVYLRDGELCLMIRIADWAGKFAVGTHLIMYFINKANIEDGNSFEMQQLKVESFGFNIFPLEIVHIIDSRSPLWKVTPHDLLTKAIEIVVVAEGLSVITGQQSQNRTSYINSDIMWGYRFDTCVNFDSKKKVYIINNKNINKIFPIDTPLCSAHELKRIKKIEL